MIEEQLKLLIEALDRNTEAHTHAPTGDAPAAPVPQPAAAPVPSAAPAPAAPVAATPTPAAAAPPAAASPSSITLDHLKAEVTRVYRATVGANPTDSRVLDIVNRYGGDLNTVAPEQYQNLINEVNVL